MQEVLIPEPTQLTTELYKLKKDLKHDPDSHLASVEGLMGQKGVR